MNDLKYDNMEDVEEIEASKIEAKKFRKRGREIIDYVANNIENIEKRNILPNVERGYIQTLISPEAPEKPDHWEDIMNDLDNVIMPGITEWNHPNLHSFFPSGNSFASIYGDILSSGLGGLRITWATSPASTELEVIVLDWLVKALHIPEDFLSTSEEGGGIIYNSCSEATLVSIFAARNKALETHCKDISEENKYSTISKLVGYYSDQANLSIERVGILSMIKMKKVRTVNRQMPSSVLKEMIDEDIKNGFIPFYCVATLGTTGSCAFDNLEEIGPICEKHNIWLHVDAAYAGAAFICPEFRYLMKGIEYVMSFVFNPHKWFLVNIECTTVWFKKSKYVVECFETSTPFMEPKSGKNIRDLRYWQIHLGSRFRSLKLWFVLRLHGIEGIQNYIRNHVRLAHFFEQLLKLDGRFEIVEEVTVGLVCFRLKGSNEMNKKLYTRIKKEGKIHILISKFTETDTLFLRFAICYQFSTEEHIRFSYQSIIDSVNNVLMEE